MKTLLLLGIGGLVISWGLLYFRYGDPSKIDARKYSLPPAPVHEGVLAQNDALTKTERLMEGQIVGPESLVVEGDVIYTGLADGRVVKIEGGKIVKEIRFTKNTNCGTYETEPVCGRPLGIRRYSADQFIVMDAYLGIYIVSFDSKDKKPFRQIVSAQQPVDGRPLMFFNDLDILNDDEFIFSDSSSKYGRRHFMHVFFEGVPNGRIFHHKISTGVTTMLVDNMLFPNGVQILPDKKSFVFAECAMGRIHRYDFATKKTSIFADSLPGRPDNIRLASDNTLWVGLSATREAGKFDSLEKMGKYPQVRQFLIDILPGHFPIKHLSKMKPKHVVIIQLDLNGKIIRSLHDVKGEKVSDIAQVNESNGYLYLGSFANNYIGRLKL